MAKHGVRLALVFLGLFAVVSRAQDVELAGEPESKTAETTAYEVALEKSSTVDLPPLTMIRFRRGRPCRGLVRRREVVPYSGDIILSSGGDCPIIPITWTEFQRAEMPRHHPRDRDDRDDEFDHHHRHRHGHDHDYHGHEHENGFLKGLRKFLGRF